VAVLTVLMPTYNVELYIADAIESVLMQQVDFNYRLIIIDDKSTDNSLMIAQRYQTQFPQKITILENEVNLGLLRTIFKAYDITKTDYFCVLDPDDYYIDDRKFQKAINFLDANSDYAVYVNNTYKLDTKTGKKSPYINAKHDGCTSDFQDYLSGTSVLGHTAGSIYRNVYCKDGVPAKLYDAIGTCSSDSSFRGDAFRNILHIYHGKAYFKNDLASVYRYTGTGIWSSTSEATKLLSRALFFYDNSVFLANKSLIYNSYKAFKQFEYKTSNLFSINVEGAGLDVYKGRSLLNIEKLLSAYAMNKELIEELSNKSRKSLKNKFYFAVWKMLDKKVKSKGLF
jgi:glycosyltransferase involved in cell wall biosynthesis